MSNIIEHSLIAKLKTCKHPYIVANIDSNRKELLKELAQDIQQGNEITLSKIVGKDVVNLLKLYLWQIVTHR